VNRSMEMEVPADRYAWSGGGNRIRLAALEVRFPEYDAGVSHEPRIMIQPQLK